MLAEDLTLGVLRDAARSSPKFVRALDARAQCPRRGAGLLVAWRFGLPRLNAARARAWTIRALRAQGGPLPRLDMRWTPDPEPDAWTLARAREWE